MEQKIIGLTRSQLIDTLLENKVILEYGLNEPGEFERFNNRELVGMYRLAEENPCNIAVIEEKIETRKINFNFL
jgi:hypothetical protein